MIEWNIRNNKQTKKWEQQTNKANMPNYFPQERKCSLERQRIGGARKPKVALDLVQVTGVRPLWPLDFQSFSAHLLQPAHIGELNWIHSISRLWEESSSTAGWLALMLFDPATPRYTVCALWKKHTLSHSKKKNGQGGLKTTQRFDGLLQLHRWINWT